MNPLPIQLGLSALGILAMWRLVSSRGRAANLSRLAVVGPGFALALAVVWFPDLSTRFARLIGVNRGVDAILYISIAALSYLVIKLYVALEKQDQTITKLVSEMAISKGPMEERPVRFLRIE